MKRTIIFFLASFSLAACNQPTDNSLRQSLNAKMHKNMHGPMVYWVVINPQKINNITDRKNIAACIDYRPYKDLLRTNKKTAIFLKSLIPPVYSNYTSIPFLIDTNITPRDYANSGNDWIFLNPPSGVMDSPHLNTIVTLRKKLGLKISSNVLPFTQFLEEIRKRNYGITVVAAKDESRQSPWLFLEQMLSLNLIDTLALDYKMKYDRFKTASNEIERLKLLAEIEHYLQEEYIIIPLYYVLD
jgi:hypothetical protein